MRIDHVVCFWPCQLGKHSKYLGTVLDLITWSTDPQSLSKPFFAPQVPSTNGTSPIVKYMVSNWETLQSLSKALKILDLPVCHKSLSTLHHCLPAIAFSLLQTIRYNSCSPKGYLSLGVINRYSIVLYIKLLQLASLQIYWGYIFSCF